MPNIKAPIDACEKCGGPVYDNRQSKISPKSPDFKCKDQACGEAFWIQLPKQARPVARGGFAPRAPKWESWMHLQRAYWRCLSIAKTALEKAVPDATAADIVAAAATIFIAVGRDGVKPEQPARPVEQPLEEKPKAVAEVQAEADDFLPY